MYKEPKIVWFNSSKKNYFILFHMIFFESNVKIIFMRARSLVVSKFLSIIFRFSIRICANFLSFSIILTKCNLSLNFSSVFKIEKIFQVRLLLLAWKLSVNWSTNLCSYQMFSFCFFFFTHFFMMGLYMYLLHYICIYCSNILLSNKK